MHTRSLHSQDILFTREYTVMKNLYNIIANTPEGHVEATYFKTVIYEHVFNRTFCREMYAELFLAIFLLARAYFLSCLTWSCARKMSMSRYIKCVLSIFFFANTLAVTESENNLLQTFMRL